MPQIQLSERFLSQLPTGRSAEDVIFLHVAAEVMDFEPNEAQVALAGLAQASPPKINAEGKPTIMKIVAWMVHEGVNANRQYFVRDELQAIAPTLFREPNFGVMDFNHSAVRPFAENPQVIGVWHKAEYRYDETAKQYGILATGMLFSWLFPDLADTLLAEQVRKGRMSFSMAALPTSTETGEDANGPYMILHHPVFFTVSALDVPPADKNALGQGTEDPETSDDALRQRLLAAAHEHPWQATGRMELQAAELQKTATTEGAAMEKELEELKAANAALVEKVAALSAEIETMKKPIEEALETAKAEVEALKTKIAELETARESANTERDAAIKRVEELEALVTELTAFKTEREASDAAAVRKAKLAERMAALPKSFVEAHARKPEEKRARLETKWEAISDEEWPSYVEDELLGYNPDMKVSYLDRSNREGPLPTGGNPEEDGIAERVRKLLNK